MADTASLIARVKTEGAEQSAKQLDDFATSAGKADTSATKMASSVDKATPKLKGFGTGAQQIGYQVQDMIVQIQGGTSAFVAIGQQGSQLAGAFGPGGAVIGAIIALSAAVAGTLVKSLGGAKVSAEELQASTKTLDDVLQKNKDGTYELSDSFVELANNVDTASQAQANFYQAQAAATTQTEGAQEAIKNLVDDLDTWTNGSAIGAQRSLELGQQTSSLTGYIEDLSNKFGLTNEEATELVPLLAAVQKNASPQNIKALSDQVSNLNNKYDGTNSALVKFVAELFKNIAAMRTAQSQADTLANSQDSLGNSINSSTQRLKEQNDQIIKNVQIGNLAEKDRVKAQAAADKEAFAKRKGVTKEQIDAYNAARDEEARQDLQRINDTEAKKLKAEQESAAKRAASEAQQSENKKRQQEKQAQNFLDTLARQNSDELKAIDAQEQQKLAKLQEFQQTGAINAKQYEDAKTAIVLEADTARAELLQKQKDEREKQQNNADTLLAQIQAQNEGELAEMDRQNAAKLKKLNEYHEQGLILEQAFNDAKDQMVRDSVIKQSTYSAQQFSNVFGDLSASMKEGSKEAKAFAIMQATVNTFTSAVNAYMSASAIPVIGWVMGPIAAAAAVAAGLANVAKIRSAREQGGALAAGGISMVGERNKAELIMPAGASRVRTMEQVQQMMGGKQNNNGNGGVVIVNNTSAKIDSATTETDNEGRLRVIISETVSRALQDSNSDISKSRRMTRGAPGY